MLDPAPVANVVRRHPEGNHGRGCRAQRGARRRRACWAGLIALLGGAEALLAQNTDVAIAMQQTTGNPVLTQTNVEYRVIVSSLGTRDPRNVVTRITFPTGFGSVTGSGTGFTCGTSGTVITCTVSRLERSAPQTISVRAMALTFGGISRQLTVASAVDPDDALNESNEGNNTSSVVTTVDTRADLDPSLTGSATTATAGQNLRYVLSVRNLGDRTVPGGTLVRSTLPPQVDFIRTLDRTFPPACTRNGQTVDCFTGGLGAGITQGVTIEARVLSLVPDGERMLFTTVVDPNNTVVERNERNNTAFVVTRVTALADLRVTGTRTSGCDVLTGFCNFNLTLTVHNDGPGQSAGTALRVTLPAGYADGTTLCPAGQLWFNTACLAPSGVVCPATCTIGSIAPGSHTAALRVSGRANLSKFGVTVVLPTVVDPANTVTETNENNNGLTFTFTQ